MTKNSIRRFLILSSAVVLIGCRTSQVIQPQCVIPPPTKLEEDRKKIVNIATKLEKLPVTVDLKADFSTVVKAEFGTVQDDIAALTVFCNAIGCYLDKGKAGKELAKEMLAFVRDWWNKLKRNQGGGADEWSPDERRQINGNPTDPIDKEHSRAIFALGERLGVH